MVFGFDFSSPIIISTETHLSYKGPEMEADFWGFDGTSTLQSMPPWEHSQRAKLPDTETLSSNKPNCSLPLAQVKSSGMISSHGGSVSSSKSGDEIYVLDRPLSEASAGGSTQYDFWGFDSFFPSLPLTLDSTPETMKYPRGSTFRLPEGPIQLSHEAQKEWDSNAPEKRSHTYGKLARFPFKYQRHQRHSKYRGRGISKRHPSSDSYISRVVVLVKRRHNESDLETKLARLGV